METNEAQRAAIHVYSASVPWPEVAKLQIAELEATAAAQTAEINRLIDRLDYCDQRLREIERDLVRSIELTGQFAEYIAELRREVRRGK